MPYSCQLEYILVFHMIILIQEQQIIAEMKDHDMTNSIY